MNKKEVVAPGREESISLKDNKILPKDIGKKKKPKQISLQKLDLGTNPINISSSNEFLDINNIFNFYYCYFYNFIFLEKYNISSNRRGRTKNYRNKKY